LVHFDVSYDLDSLLLQGIDALGLLERKAEQDLQRLKEHLEQSSPPEPRPRRVSS
jgi:hypothetical protein